MRKVGVILSGCGYLDGTEIQEAIITLLALDRAGVEVVAMAPNKPQAHVVNHLTNEEQKGESRSVLIESARLVRGNIIELKPELADQLDALIVPGGYGVAKNLCDYAFEGIDFTVDESVASLIQHVVAVKKPVGVICIAPVLMARTLERIGVSAALTIGTDPNTARDIEQMNSRHVNCSVSDIAVDRVHKIVSTPAWMLGPRISDVERGIVRLVAEVIALIDE